MKFPGRNQSLTLSSSSKRAEGSPVMVAFHLLLSPIPRAVERGPQCQGGKCGEKLVHLGKGLAGCPSGWTQTECPEGPIVRIRYDEDHGGTIATPVEVGSSFLGQAGEDSRYSRGFL